MAYIVGFEGPTLLTHIRMSWGVAAIEHEGNTFNSYMPAHKLHTHIKEYIADGSVAETPRIEVPMGPYIVLAVRKDVDHYDVVCQPSRAFAVGEDAEMTFLVFKMDDFDPYCDYVIDCMTVGLLRDDEATYLGMILRHDSPYIHACRTLNAEGGARRVGQVIARAILHDDDKQDMYEYYLTVLSTKVVNLRKKPYDVYIGRAGNGQDGYFGSPIVIGAVCPECGITHQSAASTLPCFREYFYRRLHSDQEFLERVIALRGKTLGCFCSNNICHGRVIADYVDCNVEA